MITEENPDATDSEPIEADASTDSSQSADIKSGVQEPVTTATDDSAAPASETGNEAEGAAAQSSNPDDDQDVVDQNNPLTSSLDTENQIPQPDADEFDSSEEDTSQWRTLDGDPIDRENEALALVSSVESSDDEMEPEPSSPAAEESESDRLEERAVPRTKNLDMTHPLVQDIILDPTRWGIWPAIAVLRWLLRRATRDARRIVYRAEPSLSFTPSEINDVAVDSDGIELILNAPGIASPGSPLPTSDIARIIADKREGGALAAWLDGFSDRFMHALESSQVRNNVAFALATGGRAKSLELIGGLVGYSAPLSAYSEGRLSTERKNNVPEGAIGLASMYVGAISARGLESLFHAFTGLPTTVKEFTGAEVPIARSARVGGRFNYLLGFRCNRAEAGIEIIIEGGSEPNAANWAGDLQRRNSLRLLAASYIGSPSPKPTIFLLLNPDHTPVAKLDGSATLGALAVLGKPQFPIFIPFIK